LVKAQGDEMNVLERLIYIFGLGIGATIIMDIWLLILKRFNIPTLNFALLGRWIGWILRGKIQHQSIAQSPEIRHEYLLGWIAHYSVGVIFSFSFILMVGKIGWLNLNFLLHFPWCDHCFDPFPDHATRDGFRYRCLKNTSAFY
jgi:hypothetical protein